MKGGVFFDMGNSESRAPSDTLESMSQNKRGILQRLGIVLLNLLSPGLGLLRVGHWRIALAVFSAALVGLLLFHFGPPMPFAVLVVMLGVPFLSLLISMWLSWRLSHTRNSDLGWYAMWYCIVGAATLVICINFLLNDSSRFRYRSFYVPSEAMEPLLAKGDRFIAYMGSTEQMRRGDLVLVRTPGGATYVKRVAAIGGDRFAMKGGIVFLNGAKIPQRVVGYELKQELSGVVKVQRLMEQFPGEGSAHQIYDAGPTPQDDVPELEVPPGSVFLLGDNRDLSADSRVSIAEGGLGGAAAISDIVGRPYYVSWGSSRPMGTRL